MSRIKDLKSDPEHIINVIDVLSIIVPLEKTVYIEMLLRIMKKTNDYDKANEDLVNYFHETYGTSKEKLLKIHKFTRNFRTTHRTIKQIFGINKYRPAKFNFIFDFFRLNNIFNKERYLEIDNRLKKLDVKPRVGHSFKDLDLYLSSKI